MTNKLYFVGSFFSCFFNSRHLFQHVSVDGDGFLPMALCFVGSLQVKTMDVKLWA